MRAVLAVAQSVLAELDVDAVLARVLEAAVELTGARYAAVGVLDDARAGLARFVTVGLSEEEQRAIGPLPRGRGVLGELIAHPAPLRLADVGLHPRSYGFPSGHPQMRSFLGVPVPVAGVPYGNLYLTDKLGGDEFTAADEEAAIVLAQFAGVAVDHAQRFAGVDARRDDLERRVAAFDASIQISRALGTETDVGSVLELVAKRARALVDARTVLIGALDGDEMTLAAGAGQVPEGVLGQRVALEGTVGSVALATGRTQHLDDDVHQARFERRGLGRLGLTAATGLAVPLVFRGQGHGILTVLDRRDDDAPYTAEEARVLEAFAGSAAIAIATARSVTAERRRQRMAAGEDERRRWARQLHDDTLQGLSSLRVALAGVLPRDDPSEIRAAVGAAVDRLESEIAALRWFITDLRPAALDVLGVEAAIETLVERFTSLGLAVDVRIDLAYEGGRALTRHAPELESALCRIVQEALANARGHGKARHATVAIQERENVVDIAITDDGDGFDPRSAAEGFGLMDMRERVDLLGGRLELASSPGSGAVVRATIPVTRVPPPG